MSYYYFLMAQLPALIPASRPLLGYDEFQELALRYLSRRDRMLLDNLTLEPSRDDTRTGSAVIDGWTERERALRLALARLRAQKLNRSVFLTTGEIEAVSGQIAVSQIARNVLAMENPLEAERYLIDVRTRWLNEMRGNHFFDSEAVFLYGLSLLLRERADRFTVEAGQDAYSSIYTQILGEEA